MNQGYRNNFAFLIAGNEYSEARKPYRFDEEIIRYYHYMVYETKFDPSRVRLISARYSERDSILEELNKFFENVKVVDPEGDIILIYTGHGNVGRISPELAIRIVDPRCDGGEIYKPRKGITYKELGDLIKQHEGRFLFINDCCYSSTAIDIFKELKLLPERGLVIASSQNDELAYTFYDKLLRCYRKNKPFRRRKIGTEETSPIPVVKFYRKYKRSKKIISDVIDHIDYRSRVVKSKFKINGEIQHPVRCGISLDYLLFKDL